MSHAAHLCFALLAELEARGVPLVLVTVTDTGGSAPRLAGARLAVWAEGCAGTVGGGAFEHRCLAEARALLAHPHPPTRTLSVHLAHDLGMCCGGRMTALLTYEAPTPRLLILGAGHVGTALAALAAALGEVRVVVVDERREWADPARFPAAVVVHEEDPQRALARLRPGPTDAVVVVTHDHGLDEALIRDLASHPAGYVGLIGSRAKWARFRTRLAGRGVPEEALARVRCPVGLPIGASSPGEIAVSVLAEWIAARTEGAAGGSATR
jgi:xanthine dehydrogenase accessory factor